MCIWLKKINYEFNVYVAITYEYKWKYLKNTWHHKKKRARLD